MAEVVKRRWQSDIGSYGLPRRDMRSCDYEAYIPDPLIDRPFAFDGDVAADIADAQDAISRMNVETTAPVDTEALARILLRAEAVASSRIEGLEIGARPLLRAEAARTLRVSPSDITAREVLANIDAMIYGVESIGADDEITLELLLEIHRRLLAGTFLDRHAGRVREVQNWIGGSSYNPCSAAYVPPPPEHVEDLLLDLCSFCNTEDLPAVAQAAIAHAQFETIHPFADGNGRTGRALIHLVLRRRGLALRVLPPVSLVLATMARSYIDGLTRYRYLGAPTSREAAEGMNTWVARFAAAYTRCAHDAASFQARANQLEHEWRERLGAVRAKSATDVLLRSLIGAPILTVQSAEALLGRTYKPTRAALDRLVEAGVLKPIKINKRSEAYEAPEIIDAFTALERQLASPDGDTLASPPVRRVPYRRR
jgi:Fic family protein